MIFTNAVRQRKCDFNLPASYTNALRPKICERKRLAPLRKTGQVAGAAVCRDQHKPLMFFRLKIKPRSPLVFIFAGEIRANRHNPAFHLISLPLAIVQFSAVLPSRFRSHIFWDGIFNLQIQPLTLRYHHVSEMWYER